MLSWKTIPFAATFLVLQGQDPAPRIEPPRSVPADQTPVVQSPATPPLALYRLKLVQGETMAMNYHKLTSSTKVDLKGTGLAPEATGIAKIKPKDGHMQIIAKVRDLPPASNFGGEYLTYVLWGISPEGRVANLGELALKKKKASLEISEAQTTFALLVTAEPYFAVTQPSDVVVMENQVGPKTGGDVEQVAAKYNRLQRGQYALNLASTARLDTDPRTPPELSQARNAVRIARASGAEFYAADPYGRARMMLQQAERAEGGDASQRAAARESIQKAEDARLIAVQNQAGQQAALEKRLAEDKVEAARKEAAAALTAQAEAQRMAAQVQSENDTLRSQLVAQLNAVLQTRATARGLIVNMSGVLFKTGKATLLPAAREKLAKIAGILAAHKGLKIEADGYTDSTGSEAFNQQLSEKRAMITKAFLVQQGVPEDAIVFKGFGPGAPIAPNDSEAGRQENRRVELVVTGEGITPAAPPPAQ